MEPEEIEEAEDVEKPQNNTDLPERYRLLCQFTPIDTEERVSTENRHAERTLYSCLCRGCSGLKAVDRYFCPTCLFQSQMQQSRLELSFLKSIPRKMNPKPIPIRLYSRRQIDRIYEETVYPACGHSTRHVFGGPRRQTVPCPRCSGSGRVARWLTERQAITEERREEEHHKLMCSRMARRFKKNRWTEWVNYLPQCGAMTQKGKPCRWRCVPGKIRCRRHGGLSTGPRSAEGRARIAKALRDRHAQQRNYLTINNSNTS